MNSWPGLAHRLGGGGAKATLDGGGRRRRTAGMARLLPRVARLLPGAGDGCMHRERSKEAAVCRWEKPRDRAHFNAPARNA